MPEDARIAAKVIWISGAIIGVLNSIGLVAARNYIGRIFTRDEGVIELVAEIVSTAAGSKYTHADDRILVRRP